MGDDIDIWNSVVCSVCTGPAPLRRCRPFLLQELLLLLLRFSPRHYAQQQPLLPLLQCALPATQASAGANHLPTDMCLFYFSAAAAPRCRAAGATQGPATEPRRAFVSRCESPAEPRAGGAGAELREQVQHRCSAGQPSAREAAWTAERTRAASAGDRWPDAAATLPARIGDGARCERLGFSLDS